MRIVRLSIVNSIKVQSQLILLCLIMSIPLILHQIENLINQSKVLTNLVKVITSNQIKVSIIGKNLFNQMKVSKQNQSKVSI